MELFAAMAGIGITSVTLLSVLLSGAYTLWWFWMVIDSIARDTKDYPAGVDKMIWVLLNAFLQPAFILYFFLVYRAEATARDQAAVRAA